MATMVPPIPTTDEKKIHDVKVDYSNLPCPIPFEELHREAMSLSSLSLFRF
jgi:mitochondrial import receptor subunit TOM40